MELKSSDYFKGQLLIAMPGLLDPNFDLTVTLLCEHNDEGAIGIVLNRVHPSLSGKDIFEELELKPSSGAGNIPIHIGGPVNINEIFVLHGPPFKWEGCYQINPAIGMSNTIDILAAVSGGSGPVSYIISLGCAGWGPGQLESEIMQNTWLTSSVLEEIIFDIPVEERWEAAVRRMGIDPTLLTDAAGHA
jgi:putative transcriptional regulator